MRVGVFRPGRGGGLSPSKPKGGTRSGSSRKGNRTGTNMASETLITTEEASE